MAGGRFTTGGRDRLAGKRPPRRQPLPAQRGLRCESCGKALTAAEPKNGGYSCYIRHSLLKKGRGTCDTPRLNSKSFEKLIIDQIRENVLTESNIRDLVKLLDEEMDGAAREQRERLETIEQELEDVKKRLGRIWQFVETTDIEMADASERIKEHRDRQQQLEIAAEEARSMLAERRAVRDSADTIAAFAEEMSEFSRPASLPRPAPSSSPSLRKCWSSPAGPPSSTPCPCPTTAPSEKRTQQNSP